MGVYSDAKSTLKLFGQAQRGIEKVKRFIKNPFVTAAGAATIATGTGVHVHKKRRKEREEAARHQQLVSLIENNARSIGELKERREPPVLNLTDQEDSPSVELTRLASAESALMEPPVQDAEDIEVQSPVKDVSSAVGILGGSAGVYGASIGASSGRAMAKLMPQQLADARRLREAVKRQREWYRHVDDIVAAVEGAKGEISKERAALP